MFDQGLKNAEIAERLDVSLTSVKRWKRALREGGPHRASGEMAAHVVDVMEAALASSAEGRHVAVASTFARPAPLA